LEDVCEAWSKGAMSSSTWALPFAFDSFGLDPPAASLGRAHLFARVIRPSNEGNVYFSPLRAVKYSTIVPTSSGATGAL
jgi:hypothetical protein